MLDTTLSTEFIPGTNVKGEVAGANWSFLLPSLELERIVCFGLLPATRLASLARLAGEVVVICADVSAADAIDESSRKQGLENVRTISLGGTAALPDASVSLALIVAASDIRWLGHDRALQLELRRVLKPTGLIYFERRGLSNQLMGGRALRRLADAFGAPQLYWLTPLRGEMHTAVPVQDQATMRYFLRYGLTSRSIDLGAFKRAARTLNSQRAPQAAAAPRATASVKPARGGLKARIKRATHTTLAGLYQRLQSTLDGAENGLNANPLLGRFARRYGALIGRGAAQPTGQPPAYLRQIASDAGISIANHRWGLSARGEYRSRKVLFFLFNRMAVTPEYIVKMTRDPALNPRLENEYRALAWLEAHGIGDIATLPRAVFHGHHNELAIVGETIVDGVPFEQRSSAAADCPLAQAGIDWLTELGANTADTSATTPLQVAEALGELFTRFAEIYQLTPTQHAFLAEQIAAIGRSHGQFPLVFQHGDPGTWNIMVTHTDRIAFLDWEAAEPQGMPLWDLFYFVRTYGAWAARATIAGDVTKGFARQFLSQSPFQTRLVEATARYCERVNLPRHMIEPLFYTCWMHRALKEATRLSADRLEHGHYVNVLRSSIEQRAALLPLFALKANE